MTNQQRNRGYPKDPGFEAGNHKLICDECGFIFRRSAMKMRWDGLMVCEDDFEVRHPMDFLESREDDQAPDVVRPEQKDRFVSPTDPNPGVTD